MKNIQNYVRPQTLEEAYELNQKKNARIIGGMMWIHAEGGNIGTAIDLSGLGLNTVEEDDEEFRIGAMVTLRELEHHESFEQYCNGAFEQAVRDIVGVQFRNMATVGGSIWGRFGFSDVLTVLLAMDSYVELYKGGILSLKEFAETEPDNDILLRVIVKKTPLRIAYRAVRAQRTDLPILTCAISALDGKNYAAVGARPGRAILKELPGFTGEAGIATTTASASGEAIGTYLAEQIPTDSNLRGSAAYRTHLIKVLAQRCVEELMQSGSGAAQDDTAERSPKC